MSSSPGTLEDFEGSGVYLGDVVGESAVQTLIFLLQVSRLNPRKSLPSFGFRYRPTEFRDPVTSLCSVTEIRG